MVRRSAVAEAKRRQAEGFFGRPTTVGGEIVSP
jgi:hypothetical protein